MLKITIYENSWSAERNGVSHLNVRSLPVTLARPFLNSDLLLTQTLLLYYNNPK